MKSVSLRIVRVACSPCMQAFIQKKLTGRGGGGGGGQAGYPSALAHSHLRGSEGTPPQEIFCFLDCLIMHLVYILNC